MVFLQYIELIPVRQTIACLDVEFGLREAI